MSHTHEIRIIAARRRYNQAQENCPHWDFDGDGDVDDCCAELKHARNQLRNALRSNQK